MTDTEVLSLPKFKPSHPGGIFKRQVLAENNLTVTEAAERLGITRKHMSNFCNEHVPCSVDLAQRIAAATGSGVAMWINLQAKYDTWVAEHSEPPKVKAIG